MKSYKDSYKELFGEELKRESYKLVPHSFSFISRVGKSVCSRCGLVYLKNDFSEWSVKMGCNSSDHPSYQSKRKLTGFDK